MSGLHPDLDAIAQAVTVLAADRYRLLGDERRIPPGADEPPQAMMLRSLESEMYYRLYRRPGAAAPGDPVVANLETMRGFAAALSQANAGAGTWDPGWAIEGRAGDGGWLVRRDGATYQAAPDEVRIEADSGCRVRVPKEMRQLVRGFYMALGDADWPAQTQAPGMLARFYWALSAAMAPAFVAAVTAPLNARGVPFRTKVLQDPSAYRGADAGVLYLPAGEVDGLWPLLGDIHERVRPGLRNEAPLLAREIAPGLGYAEDPGHGLSFGQARCRTAAAGLWQAFAAGAHEADGRAAHIAEAFRADGIDPADPSRRRASPLPDVPAAFGG